MTLAAENSPSSGDCQKLQARHYIMDDVNDDFDANEAPDDGLWDLRSYSRRMDSGYCTGSALAKGIHITEFSESRVNPTPLLLEESDILLEQYLSPGKLQLLAGVDDLKTVESLQLKVDSRETSLGNFGSLLPGLVELKLNGSHIACMRDLGSSLRNLRVLWMTRCGLEELDGISAMSDLQELYLEYNEISDVSPLSMLEHLELLDLEGNNIEDIVQVQYLSLCPTLRKLALDGNPICVCPTPTRDEPGYDFRGTIKKLLPNLLILDDKRLDDDGSSSDKQNVFDEDWAYLEELQDEALLQDEFSDQRVEVVETLTGDRPPTAALRPATAYQPGSALRPSSGFRPMSAPRRPSTASGGLSSLVRPQTLVSNRPASSDAVEGVESVSELTMGNVICGNPSKALRQRRQGMPGSKEDIERKLSKLLQKGAVFGHPKDADNLLSIENGQGSSIIEELRTWKLEHEKRMELIYKSKEAQILVVDHDEDDDFSDENEDDIDVDEEENTLLKLIEKCDYTLPNLRQTTHLADMQHRVTTPEATVAEISSPDIYSQRIMAINSIENMFSSHNAETADFVTAKTAETADFVTAKTADFVTAKTTDFVTAKTADSSSKHARYDQSFDVEDDNLESTDLQSKLPSSSMCLPTYKQPTYHRDLYGQLGMEVHRSAHRQLSRNRSEASLAPLRVPSSTSTQIINKMLYKPTELPSPQQKKLRVGPTGLPLSGQTQQPVIRNNIAVIQSRGLVHSCRAGGSQTNIVLLPSQPRIQTHIPEAASLIPHPPSSS